MKKYKQAIFLTLIFFIFLSFLSLIHFLTRIGLFLGESVKLSDRVIAWTIIIFTFPVRNIINLFSDKSDEWFQNEWGYFVIIVSSIIWAITTLFVKEKIYKIWSNKN